jgi:hypothetical protein
MMTNFWKLINRTPSHNALMGQFASYRELEETATQLINTNPNLVLDVYKYVGTFRARPGVAYEGTTEPF